MRKIGEPSAAVAMSSATTPVRRARCWGEESWIGLCTYPCPSTDWAGRAPLRSNRLQYARARTRNYTDVWSIRITSIVSLSLSSNTLHTHTHTLVQAPTWLWMDAILATRRTDSWGRDTCLAGTWIQSFSCAIPTPKHKTDRHTHTHTHVYTNNYVHWTDAVRRRATPCLDCRGKCADHAPMHRTTSVPPTRRMRLVV